MCFSPGGRGDLLRGAHPTVQGQAWILQGAMFRDGAMLEPSFSQSLEDGHQVFYHGSYGPPKFTVERRWVEIYWP